MLRNKKNFRPNEIPGGETGYGPFIKRISLFFFRHTSSPHTITERNVSGIIRVLYVFRDV